MLSLKNKWVNEYSRSSLALPLVIRSQMLRSYVGYYDTNEYVVAKYFIQCWVIADDITFQSWLIWLFSCRTSVRRPCFNNMLVSASNYISIYICAITPAAISSEGRTHFCMWYIDNNNYSSNPFWYLAIRHHAMTTHEKVRSFVVYCSLLPEQYWTGDLNYNIYIYIYKFVTNCFLNHCSTSKSVGVFNDGYK